MKCGILPCIDHVAGMGKTRNAYKIFRGEKSLKGVAIRKTEKEIGREH